MYCLVIIYSIFDEWFIVAPGLGRVIAVGQFCVP